MKLYEILRTENTEDCMESLIGMIFPLVDTDETGTFKLLTCDGELYFEGDEVREITAEDLGESVYETLWDIANNEGIESNRFMDSLMVLVN